MSTLTIEKKKVVRTASRMPRVIRARPGNYILINGKTMMVPTSEMEREIADYKSGNADYEEYDTPEAMFAALKA